MSNKKTAAILLILVLFIAAGTRFAGLKDRGIMCADEGFYLNGAKTYCAAIGYFCKKLVHQPPGLSFSEHMFKYGGGYPYAGKPLIYPIIVLSFLIFGVHDYSTLFISAACGVGSVWMLYYIGKEAFNKRTGIIAALFLSLSPYHIHYTRSGIVSIPLSTFFVLCAFWFYIKSVKYAEAGSGSRRSNLYMLLTGMGLATAVACHYNVLWVFLFLFAVDILGFVIKRKMTVTRQVFRSAVFTVSYICALSIYILPYTIAEHIAKEFSAGLSGKAYHIQSYLEQMVSIYNCLSGLHVSTKNAFFYVTLLRIVENPTVLFLAMAGLVMAGNSLRKRFLILEFAIFALCVFPIAMWSFYTYACGRTLTVMIPFVMLAAAYCFDRFAAAVPRGLRYQGIILAALLGIVAGLGIYRSIPFTEERSGYAHAIEYMRARGSVKHISNNPAVSVFYVGNDNTNVTSEFDLADVREKYLKKGYKFFLNVSGRSEAEYSSRCLYDLIVGKSVRPVFIAYSSPLIALFDYPVLISDGGQLRRDMTIEVYALKDILE